VFDCYDENGVYLKKSCDYFYILNSGLTPGQSVYCTHDFNVPGIINSFQNLRLIEVTFEDGTVWRP